MSHGGRKAPREVQRFLNDLIRDSKTGWLSWGHIGELKGMLEDHLGRIEGQLLEYDRDPRSRWSKWILSERNPLAFKNVRREGDSITLDFDSNAEWHGGDCKYLIPPLKYAFLRESGIYIALGTDHNGFSVVSESAYLPKERIMDLLVLKI